ncbi:MAG: A/G-specific adenine glycosylase [bacterium]|nr:A/G-specific adenine glycosylase [bacterium]
MPVDAGERGFRDTAGVPTATTVEPEQATAAGDLRAGSAGALQEALLAWAEPRLRDLPWRRTRDPWRVLVAEVMLQQTGVSRVLERYDDFCARFPTPAVCAAAPAGAVIEAWRGLGYNRRALHLHAAARRINAAGGRFPDDLDGLLALPGVGPYTARAVLALAFERDVGVVDTNVGRLLARLGGRRLTRAEAQRAADRLVPPGQAWLWNQALFDLGATVCTRRAPACAPCPVRQHCAWRGEGPDPADGSAGVSVAQAPFEGSDRQCRGRLVEALRSGPQPASAAAHLMGLEDDPPRARRIVASLLRDGLVIERDGALHLPV